MVEDDDVLTRVAEGGDVMGEHVLIWRACRVGECDWREGVLRLTVMDDPVVACSASTCSPLLAHDSL